MVFTDNIDWFSFSFNYIGEFFFSERYDFQLVGAVQGYACLYNIVDKRINTVVADLKTQPRGLRGMSPNFKVIQIKNRFLYTKEYVKYFQDFQRGFGFGENYNIVRVDLCRDFEILNKGLRPQSFMYGVVTGKYVLKGKSKTKVGFNNSHDVLIERMYNKYKTSGYMRVIHNTVEVETLYVGTHKNDICKIMYNKTKELREGTYKPYIAELHEGVFGENHGDIYRLEFSLKGTNIDVIRKDTGEFGKVRVEDLADVTGLIRYLLKKKYKFLIADDKANKSRDWKEVELFTDEDAAKYELKQTERKSNSNRSQKTFLKNLTFLPKSMRNNDIFNDERVQRTIEKFKRIYSKEYSLEEYYYNKIIPEYEHYVRKELKKK